ncbi:PKD-like domain-containing protein, partial [Terrimonas alba]|uniref:PKD-like domain-containing protein n=1 Tax=Terrimonas alba TaxID=3349636 RepID=UPI0035F40DF0
GATATALTATASGSNTLLWYTVATGGTGSATAPTPSTAAAGSTTYYVSQVTSLNCEGPRAAITVTVNPTPAAPTVTTPVVYCQGATATALTATASGSNTLLWYTVATGGTGSATAPTPSTAAAGSTTYYVSQVTSLNCEGPRASITVTVNPTPAAPTVTSPVVYCQGETATALTATPAAGNTLLWYTVATGGTGSATAPTPSTAAAGSTTYYVSQVTSLNCEGPRASITVTVNPTPAAPTVTSPVVYCQGATATALTATPAAGNTLLWYTVATGGTGSATAPTPSTAAAGSTTYYVSQVTSLNCEGPRAAITVTVNPAPAVTNANTATICSGTGPNISLTASVPSTFTWTIGTITGSVTGASPGSGSTINQVLTNPSSTTNGTVQYIVTPSSSNGCIGAAFTITVTVRPAPVVTTASTKTICSGAGTAITLTASVASTFTWTIGTVTGGITGASPGSGSSINQTLTNPSNTTAGTVEYIVTPTSSTGSCAGAPYTITVTVNPRPVVTTLNTAITCSGTGPNISLTASVPSTFAWTIGTITGTITGASAGSGTTINQTLTNPSNTTAGTVQYIVTPTSSPGGCAGSPYTITVTVNPRPAVTNANTATICSGAGPNISLTASVPSTFAWTIGTITGGITGASAGSGSAINQILTNPSSTTNGTVQYIVTPTSANGCIGAAFTITVTVRPAPTVTTAATKTICSGAGTAITLTASVASSFTWTIGTVTGGITGASAGSGSSINQTLTNPSNATAGTVEYIVTPTSTTGSCPGAPYTITVTVNPRPVVTTLNTATTCSGTGPNIALTASAPSTFAWTIGTITGGITGASAGSGATINQTLTNPSNTTAGTVQYNVTPTSSPGGCAGTAYTITVTVNPRPAVTNANTATICSGAGPNISLTASVPSTFAWTIGTITGGITGASAGSGSAINQILTNPSSTTNGTVQYIVTPTSANGCIGAAFTITVTVRPAPTVTTAATKTICSGAGTAITLTASVASSFTWTIGTVTGGITGASAGSGSSINQTLTNPSNATAGTVEYIVTPTSTTGSCPGAPYTVVVTVNPGATANAGSAQSVCAGGSVTLTGTIGGSATSSTWSAPSGTFSDPASLTSTYTPTIASGNVNLTLTTNDPDGGGPCTAATSIVVITVNTAPTVEAGGPNTVCESATPSAISLSGATIGGSASQGAWSITSGGGTLSNTGLTNNPQNVSYTPAPNFSGTVILTLTTNDPAGVCTAVSDTREITINPRAIVNAGSAQPVCAGGSINLAGTISGAATSATWSAGSGTFSDINSLTSTYTPGIASGNVTLTLTTNDPDGTGPCVAATSTVVITVNPLPTVSPITGPTNVCVDATITLASTTPGGTWSSSNPSAATIDANGTVTGVSGGSSTISYTVTNANGCTRSVTYTISVFPNPLIASAGSSTICPGSSTTLTATGGTTYTWSPVTGLSSSTGSSVTASPATTTIYTVTGTDVNGCNNTATVTVTVLPAPAGGTISPAVTTVCTGSNSGTLTLSGYSGNIIRWEYSTNGGTTWNSIANTSTSETYSNLTQTRIYRAVLSDGTCTSYSSTGVVSVIPLLPPTSAIATPPQICLGDCSTLTATADGFPSGWVGVQAFNSANLDQNEDWSATHNGAPHNIEASADNEQNTPWNLTNPIDPFGVEYDNPDNDKFAIAAGDNNTTMSSNTFNLIGMSSATFSFQQAFDLKAGASIRVEISTDGGATYQSVPLLEYIGPATLGDPDGVWDNPQIDLSDYLGLDNLKIRWNYSGTDSSIWAIDNAGITPPPLPLEYDWTLISPSGVPSPYYLNVTDQPSVTACPPAPGTYTYQVATTYAGCTGGTMDVQLIVHPIPECSIEGPATVCPGSSQTYTAPVIAGYSYQWTVTGNASINGSSTGSSVNVIVDNACGTYTVSLVTTANNCPSTPCSIIVNVVDDTPPVFTGTLNGDLAGCDISAIPAAATTVAALELLGLPISDNCSQDAQLIVTSVTGAANGSCPITVLRTYTITDFCGNSVQIPQTFTIDDNIAPQISGTLPTLPVEGCDVEAAPPPYTTIAALQAAGLTISDNCTANGSLQLSHAEVISGSCPITIERTYTITDGCGNTATAIQTITIDDTQAPTWTTAAGSLDRTVQCSDAAALDAAQALAPIATDVCDNTLVPVKTAGSPVQGANCTSTITNTWIVTDECGNTSTVFTQTITVIDNTPPVLTGTLPGGPVGDACVSNPAEMPSAPDPATIAALYTDNCNTVTAVLTNTTTTGTCNWTRTFTYTVTDGCNPITVDVVYTGGDTEAPVVDCPAAEVFCVTTDSTYTIPPLTATDNCTGTLTITYEITGATTREGEGNDASGAFNVGSSTITWTVTDACGNSSTCQTTVTINPKPAPIITHN